MRAYVLFILEGRNCGIEFKLDCMPYTDWYNYSLGLSLPMRNSCKVCLSLKINVSGYSTASSNSVIARFSK